MQPQNRTPGQTLWCFCSLLVRSSTIFRWSWKKVKTSSLLWFTEQRNRWHWPQTEWASTTRWREPTPGVPPPRGRGRCASLWERRTSPEIRWRKEIWGFGTSWKGKRFVINPLLVEPATLWKSFFKNSFDYFDQKEILRWIVEDVNASIFL